MRLFAICLFAVIFALPSQAATINVPGDQPTIRTGLAAAVVGDTVRVARGTYYENSVALKSGVTLRSETGLPDCVTIDARSLSRVVICSGIDATARIEGFTLTGGLATRGGGMYCDAGSSPEIVRCNFSGNTVSFYGGGLHCRDASSPTLIECSFTGNQAAQGGGGLDCFNSASPSLIECTFVGNAAGAEGGGMFCYGSSPTLIDCAFSSNSSAFSGGGIGCVDGSSPSITDCTLTANHAADVGGGLYCYDSSPSLVNCSFDQNVADGHGGGLSGWAGSSPTLELCRFSGNTAGAGGGGIHFENPSAPTLSSCLLVDNVANYGGGLYCWDFAAPTLSNCTFVRNAAVRGDQLGGGVACFEQSSVTFENTIIAFSPEGDAVRCESGATVSLTCCNVYGNSAGDWTGCIAGQAGTSGNFSADPLFCDPADGDFTLREDSPCSPEHSAGCGPIGALPVVCSPVSLAPDTWGGIKARFR